MQVHVYTCRSRRLRVMAHGYSRFRFYKPLSVTLYMLDVLTQMGLLSVILLDK